MTGKKPSQSIAEILSAARDTDKDNSVAAEREAAKDRVKQGVRYLGPRYAGRAIEEWMDRADAGLASIHEIRKAFYRVTPAAKVCVPALIRWLAHRHKHFRHVATRTLGLIGPEAAAAVDHLVSLLSDPDSMVRGEALESLVKIGVPRGELAKIANCMLDSDKFVRRTAINALAQLGPAAAETVPRLTAALADEQVVGQAANALAAIGPQAQMAVPALARILADHEGVEYRQAALDALGRIGTAEALQAVQAGLNDGRKEIRNAAREILGAAN